MKLTITKRYLKNGSIIKEQDDEDMKDYHFY